ncbi:MAG: protein kinase, partial [Chloroflexi bacterium]|nr:protein kinase [Chloroflexota bacterium]
MASDRVQRQIDSLLDEAEAAIKELDWRVVHDRAEAVLAIDPENPDGQTYLATAERAMGGAAPAQTGHPAISTPTSTSAAKPDHPTSFANGRYEVKRFLGEGGKKRVYLAQDTVLDREVAFSLIKTEGLSQNHGSNHLFISYVAEDSAVATQIASALEERGFSTWYYQRDSVPGPAYLAQMGEAIDHSQAMVLIISPQSVGSNQVTTEVVRAHEDNKAFIPLLRGITHEEFQSRAPVWRQALAASTSIEVGEQNLPDVVGRVIEGLEALGIQPQAQGSEAERSRITREAQAMGRLGSHPHIVTVHDLGEHEGQPFMVTEFMAGGDVEGLIEQTQDHRLPVQQAINIAKETCRGLEFAHTRGIVHRDLKPSNIWLTADGITKIGDFGLAVAIDRSRLTTEGMMIGTVSYMPPEQAMGGEVTPRADLYSLGAMLYEMVTGRPPFLGDDSVAIIGQHINTPPVAPMWHNSACPRPLESLILRLLAKDPSERPQSASDVLAALDGLDLTPNPAVASSEEAEPLDSLAGGVFVGRQREMGELKSALEDALSGRGRLVTLVGEPGIGKTRTAQELATYAGLRSAQVLWGRCYEEQGMPPYWPWVQAIRSYVREREPDQLRSEMGAGAADIAEVVSDVKERLPDLSPPPQLDSPEQARFRLFDSITAFLKSASLKQPLVLVLDDLHWADQPSLLLLQFVARELGNSRLLLLGTYRDVELSRQHPLAETLGELTRERLFQRVLLRGLSRQDVGRFIEVAAGVDPPPGLTEAVHTQTEGNPLFVTEVVRLLVQEGELTAEGTGDRDSWTVRIPEGVREVIGRRLNRLSQRCNETLTIASVIGREFGLRQLVPLVEDMSEDRLLEVLEEALGARVIEELPQAIGRYQFTHALIQETLTEELTLTRRVRLHARIAESLEALYGDSADAHAAELAHHFAEAEAVLGTDKLVRYSFLAGERALASFAYEEALEHFQKGIDAKGVLLDGFEPATDAVEAALLFGLGRAWLSGQERGRVQEAVDILGGAFDYYERAGDVARAVAVAEYPLPALSQRRTGIAQFIARALELVPPDSQQAGRLLSTYGTELGRVGNDYQGAEEAFDRALAIARREGDLALEVRALAASANVDLFHLRLQGTLEKARHIIDLASSIGDDQAAWSAHLDAARALQLMGEGGLVQQHASAALQLAEKLHDRYRLAF